MDTPAPHPGPPALLRHNTLVMQQISGFMSNDFDILDGAGEQTVGRVTTTGGGLSRLVAGSRSLDVADADGTPLLHVEDPFDIGFDRYTLTTNGAPLAEVSSRFAIMSTRVSIDVADGTPLELHGDMMGMDFEFRVGEAVAARASREWAGLSRGFLGHSRYVLSIHPTVPPQLRLAIIGGSIALDLIRQKKSNNS
ncbi:hypothetical protein [Brachybacterium sp.]|uniref:LURP-one-related/scramblase family protein n=1 Tax=Brachybacterium sp. TaxID=1891286 RepID=UPI002ED2C030